MQEFQKTDLSNVDSDNKILDVCINVWGKPFQTALAIQSLLDHSGELVDKVYLIIEREQPDGFELGRMLDLLEEHSERLVIYEPKHYLPPNELPDAHLLESDSSYRSSLRYQYALESTDKHWLLITHNDVIFHASLISAIDQLLNSRGLFGLGDVGQCWNCPLNSSCSGDLLSQNIQTQPISQDDLYHLLEANQHLRTQQRRNAINLSKPFPMPECRINEWFMFVNVDLYRQEGEKGASPIGSYSWSDTGGYTCDIGEAWFRDMIDRGYDFAHLSYQQYMVHGPFRQNQQIPQGHSSYLSAMTYQSEECLALAYYCKNYV